jgi:hypothetical protein
MYEEFVRGTIIGGHYKIGKLFYDGRCQSSSFYGNTDEELIKQARKCKAELVKEFKGHPCYLYPDDSKWELRIWD